MGTRSLTVVKDRAHVTSKSGRTRIKEEETCVLYRQFDGYPEGHGKELAEFLSGMHIVNGLGSGSGRIANGTACLAAQVVAHFKTEPGQFYLHKAGTRGAWEEYIYEILVDEYSAPLPWGKTEDPERSSGIQVRVLEVEWREGEKDTYQKLFEGTPEELLGWVEELEAKRLAEKQEGEDQ